MSRWFHITADTSLKFHRQAMLTPLWCSAVVEEDGEMVVQVAMEMTLDEWKALQEINRPKAEFNIRKAENAIPSQAKVIHQSKRIDVSLPQTVHERVTEWNVELWDSVLLGYLAVCNHRIQTVLWIYCLPTIRISRRHWRASRTKVISSAGPWTTSPPSWTSTSAASGALGAGVEVVLVEAGQLGVVWQLSRSELNPHWTGYVLPWRIISNVCVGNVAVASFSVPSSSSGD